MQLKRRLGEMLLEAGLATEEQIQDALREQRETGLKIGQCLIRLGTVSERHVIDALSRQLKIGSYEPEAYPIDRTLSQIYDVDVARKYRAVPLQKKGRLLMVAMTDPNIDHHDAIESLTDHEVEPVLCTDGELNQLIKTLYDYDEPDDWGRSAL